VAVDTYAQIWGRVLGFCPSAGALLAQRWTVDAFRRISERRTWSYLVKYNQFILPQVYNTGTVSVTQGLTAVTGSGTTFSPSMVGRQFRIGNATPIYTIASYTSATQIDLQFPWGGASVAGSGYQIYLCYLTPATDFHAFISVYDPNFNWQLRLNVSQQELNNWDAQRANTGQAYVVASYDYSPNFGSTPGLPRYEVWPHNLSNYVYPYLYESRAQDLDEPGALLPRFIRGDLVMDMALESAAKWPGPSVDDPNPYYDLNLADRIQKRNEYELGQLERQDDETFENMVAYARNLEFFPWWDARFMQDHAF